MDNSLIYKKELLFRKNKGKEYIDKYIQELNLICNFKVEEVDLISLEETDNILKKYEASEVFIKKRVKFEEKGSLKRLFENLSTLKEPIYLITEYSKTCGAIKLENAKLFNTDFRFDDEHAGIITIYSQDVKNKIILDYYEENGKSFLEIEIEGIWSQLI